MCGVYWLFQVLYLFCFVLFRFRNTLPAVFLPVGFLAGAAAILGSLAVGALFERYTFHIIFRQEAVGTKVAFLFVLSTLAQIKQILLASQAIDAGPITITHVVAVFAFRAKATTTNATNALIQATTTIVF